LERHWAASACCPPPTRYSWQHCRTPRSRPRSWPRSPWTAQSAPPRRNISTPPWRGRSAMAPPRWCCAWTRPAACRNRCARSFRACWPAKCPYSATWRLVAPVPRRPAPIFCMPRKWQPWHRARILAPRRRCRSAAARRCRCRFRQRPCRANPRARVRRPATSRGGW